VRCPYWLCPMAPCCLSPVSYRCGYASASHRLKFQTPNAMPTWPTPQGRKTITIEFSEQHVQHLDEQANYLGCSRAAYLRQLVVKDIARQAPAAEPQS
jgi:hypothetical protein